MSKSETGGEISLYVNNGNSICATIFEYISEFILSREFAIFNLQFNKQELLDRNTGTPAAPKLKSFESLILPVFNTHTTTKPLSIPFEEDGNQLTYCTNFSSLGANNFNRAKTRESYQIKVKPSKNLKTVNFLEEGVCESTYENNKYVSQLKYKSIKITDKVFEIHGDVVEDNHSVVIKTTNNSFSNPHMYFTFFTNVSEESPDYLDLRKKEYLLHVLLNDMAYEVFCSCFLNVPLNEGKTMHLNKTYGAYFCGTSISESAVTTSGNYSMITDTSSKTLLSFLDRSSSLNYTRMSVTPNSYRVSSSYSPGKLKTGVILNIMFQQIYNLMVLKQQCGLAHMDMHSENTMFTVVRDDVLNFSNKDPVLNMQYQGKKMESVDWLVYDIYSDPSNEESDSKRMVIRNTGLIVKLIDFGLSVIDMRKTQYQAFSETVILPKLNDTVLLNYTGVQESLDLLGAPQSELNSAFYTIDYNLFLLNIIINVYCAYKKVDVDRKHAMRFDWNIYFEDTTILTNRTPGEVYSQDPIDNSETMIMNICSELLGVAKSSDSTSFQCRNLDQGFEHGTGMAYLKLRDILCNKFKEFPIIDSNCVRILDRRNLVTDFMRSSSANSLIGFKSTTFLNGFLNILAKLGFQSSSSDYFLNIEDESPDYKYFSRTEILDNCVYLNNLDVKTVQNPEISDKCVVNFEEGLLENYFSKLNFIIQGENSKSSENKIFTEQIQSSKDIELTNEQLVSNFEKTKKDMTSVLLRFKPSLTLQDPITGICRYDFTFWVSNYDFLKFEEIKSEHQYFYTDSSNTVPFFSRQTFQIEEFKRNYYISIDVFNFRGPKTLFETHKVDVWNNYISNDHRNLFIANINLTEEIKSIHVDTQKYYRLEYDKDHIYLVDKRKSSEYEVIRYKRYKSFKDKYVESEVVKLNAEEYESLSKTKLDLRKSALLVENKQFVKKYEKYLVRGEDNIKKTYLFLIFTEEDMFIICVKGAEKNSMGMLKKQVEIFLKVFQCSYAFLLNDNQSTILINSCPSFSSSKKCFYSKSLEQKCLEEEKFEQNIYKYENLENCFIVRT